MIKSTHLSREDQILIMEEIIHTSVSDIRTDLLLLREKDTMDKEVIQEKVITGVQIIVSPRKENQKEKETVRGSESADITGVD